MVCKCEIRVGILAVILIFILFICISVIVIFMVWSVVLELGIVEIVDY